MSAARRAGWAIGLVVVALAAVGAWWLVRRPAAPVPPIGRPALVAPEAEPAGPAARIVGNPGWSSLAEEDRRRARRPVAPSAKEWLETHRGAVVAVARSLDVSPVALGGIVAAEKTLLVDRTDALGEELFAAVFGSLRDRDLARWVADQEAAFQRRSGEGGRGSLVKNPYLWTLGPAQVSFRLAIRYEPALADRLGRPRRSTKEVLEAVTSVPGNLEYAAALLVEAERAYRGIAGMDIGDNPGLLATLYHLGAPTVRARRLADENAARQARGEPPEPPHVNYYGAFVNLHAGEIEALLAGGSASGTAGP